MATRTKLIIGSISIFVILVVCWFAVTGFDTPPQDSIHVKGVITSGTDGKLVVTTDTGKQATLQLTETTRYDHGTDLKPGDSIDAYVQHKTDTAEAYQVISISETSR